MAQPYVGEIRMFAGNFAPVGWMFCDDQVPGMPPADSPEGQRLWSDALKPAENLG